MFGPVKFAVKSYTKHINWLFWFNTNVLNSDSYCGWVIMMEYTNLCFALVDCKSQPP